MTGQHEDAETLRVQLASPRQTVSELEQRLSDRTREMRDHELQVVANERERDRLISQLEAGRRQVAEVEQQLSTRIHEIEGLEQRATGAEREREKCNQYIFLS